MFSEAMVGEPSPKKALNITNFLRSRKRDCIFENGFPGHLKKNTGKQIGFY